MRSELIQNRVGKVVKDSYGRYVGSVIGFSIETSGELRSIGLDQGGGQFHEYPSNRIVSDSDGFIVLPRWKVDAEVLGKEADMVRRRAQALADLKKEGEVPAHLFDEMHTQYSGQLKSLQESYSNLAGEMRTRVEELDRQSENLDRFLVSLKVQFRSGEIDESTFKAEVEYCTSMKLKDSKEREDITKLLRAIVEPIAPKPAAPLAPEKPHTVAVPEVTIRQ